MFVHNLCADMQDGKGGGHLPGSQRRVRGAAAGRISQLVLFLGVVASVLTDCPDEAGDDFASVRTYALQLQQRGAGEEAIACFRVAAQLDTSRPEPWLSIGEIFRALGQYPEAVSALRRCCAIAKADGRPGAVHVPVFVCAYESVCRHVHAGIRVRTCTILCMRGKTHAAVRMCAFVCVRMYDGCV